MCSYMAMFPPSMPHVFINWLTEPGDVVYDPFSGRGTTPLEACLMGRQGLGSDANPLAWVLTSAKVDPPPRKTAMRRIDALVQEEGEKSTGDVPHHIKMLFSDFTLRRLVWLKNELDMTNRTDRFLMAVLLGRLHANADRRGVPRGLTIAMPNTFAMAPGYVSRFIDEHQLQAPEVDPARFLRDQLTRLTWGSDGFRRGRAWIQDAQARPKWPRNTPDAKLVFSSPPYLSVIKYGKFNWVRLWMLGQDPKAVDASLFSSSSLPLYQNFLKEVATNVRSVLRDDGFLCFVIGDVRSGSQSVNLASSVADGLDASGLKLIGTVVDQLPTKNKVSRIWGSNRGRATNTDRILVFAGPKASRPKAVPTLSWKET